MIGAPAFLALLALLANCQQDRPTPTPLAPAPVVTPAPDPTPSTEPPAPTPLPIDPGKLDCVGDVVLVIGFDTPTPCDVNPPQRLDVHMDDDPGPTQEQLCLDAGGDPTYDPATDVFTCIGIDY